MDSGQFGPCGPTWEQYVGQDIEPNNSKPPVESLKSKIENIISGKLKVSVSSIDDVMNYVGSNNASHVYGLMNVGEVSDLIINEIKKFMENIK